MNKTRIPIVLGVAACLLTAFGDGWAKSAAPSLPFSENLEAALEVSAETGKPVVVSFVAAWCPLCGQMKRETFRDPGLIARADEFIWVTVDIDRDLTIAQSYGVQAVPTIYFIDPAGETRSELLGFVEADELQEQLTWFKALIDEPQTAQAPPSDDVDRSRSSLIWKPNGYRSQGICFSHVGYGPLKLTSQSPFQSLRFGMRPRTPSTLGNGQFEVHANSTWVNVWGVDKEPGDPSNEYFLDFEMLQNTVSLAYGITDTLEIEGEFQNRTRFGGEMDALIQGFHDLASFDQDGRKDVPRGEFTFLLAPPGGPRVELDSRDRGSFSRTAQLSLQHNITCGTNHLPAISYSVAARVETLEAGDLGGGSDLDLGASIALARRVGRFYLYGTLGYAWFGQDSFRGIKLEDTQATILTALEWRFRPRQALIAQYLATEGMIDDFGPFGDRSNEVTLGYKWELRTLGVLEIGLIENITTFANSPDFGLHVGFSQRL